MARPTTYLSVALGLVAVGTSAYAWHLHQELVAARAKLVATQVNFAKQLGEATRPLPAPAEPAAAPSVHLTVPDTAAVESAESARAVGDRRGGAGRNSPQVQQLMAMQRRNNLDGRYAALFRKLNLNPADLEKLKSLLIERQSASMDVYNAAREQGMDARTSRDQIRDLIKNFEAESDASIHDLLGESSFQQYKQYEQTAPQRTMVSQLEQRLSYSATPLYGNQAEQLVALMATASPPAATSPQMPPFAGGAPGQYVGARPQITDAMITQSAGFLSQPQIQALREIQQEQQLQAKLLQEMQQARRNNNAGNPVPLPAGSSGP